MKARTEFPKCLASPTEDDTNDNGGAMERIPGSSAACDPLSCRLKPKEDSEGNNCMVTGMAPRRRRVSHSRGIN
jgi:hypothetical protein